MVRPARPAGLAVLLLVAAAAAGCRFDPDPRDGEGRRILRVGYMPNVTHAPALVGLEAGLFAAAIGPDAVVRARAFAAGPSVIEALFAGELDVAYVGPNPAINGFQKSRGRALRIVAGSTSGGAGLVVRPGIRRARDLAGRKVASPGLGNTQDVAFRTWLREHGMQTDDRGGTVELLPVAPADILGLFARGQIAAAWVPEPWLTRIVQEAGGELLVDERSRWPGGEFPTTVVIASTVALERRPELVRAFLRGHEDAVRTLRERPAEAQELVARRLAQELGKRLPDSILEGAFTRLSFGLDPLEPQLRRVAREAKALGFLKSEGVEGLVDPNYLP